MRWVDVVIDFPQRWADGTYCYEVPEGIADEVVAGWAVRVPFGNRELTAYVVAVHDRAPETEFVLKPIFGPLGVGPVWTSEARSLAAWISEFYVCTLVEGFQAVVPPAVLRRLLKPPSRKVRRKTRVLGLGEVDCGPPTLNTAQQEALEQILRPSTTTLLEGVTGSGKTEVYLAAVEQTLAQGQGAIVLVPEVSLTPQAIDRYRGRLGETVAILHSRLTEAERTAQWLSLLQGRCRVALGTRSAIFAPVENLGLIVIDEEHDGSYKQDNAPRYHARQVAAWRMARHNGCRLVLGSATPCLETYFLARSQRYGHARLLNRARAQTLPQVEIIDLRKHRLRPREDLSTPMLQALRQVLVRGEQAVLLYNRRGFSRYLQCQDCGKVLHCPHCSIGLTVHKAPSRAMCHYCGYQARLPDHCPGCGGVSLREKGSGTERLEDELLQRLPGVRMLRMDRDTTQRAGAHEDLLRRFANHEVDILLGTQMVAKGLDFPKVTLVGVVGADQGLHLPDFRAAERTMQLLVQVSGRAGRGDSPGRVLLQAVDADQSVFDFARGHDYIGFLDGELALRRELGYPPFARVGRLVLSSEDEEALAVSVATVQQWLSSQALEGCLVVGPAACPIEKIQGFFRWHFLFKARRVKELAEILRNALRHCKRSPNVRWAADIDPQSLL